MASTNMKTILILGSEGFIGSNLVQFYLRKSYMVFGCDLSNESKYPIHYIQANIQPDFYSLQTAITINLDYCINASGNGDVNFSVINPSADFESNTVLPFKILEYLRQYQPACSFLQISSAAVYGEVDHSPIDEQSRIQPISPYGWHKFLAEQICTSSTAMYAMKTAIVRPFSVYGPGLKKQLLWDIFKKSQLDGSIVLWGTGEEKRDFIFIDDLIEAIDMVLSQSIMNAECFNIAYGVSVSIKDIANQLLEHLSCTKEIIFNGTPRKGNPLSWQADVNKLKGIGFEPQVDLKLGLSKTAAWLQQHSS